MTFNERDLRTLYYFIINFISTSIFAVTIDGRVVELVISSRGKLQLLIDGFKYFRNTVELTKQSFRCVYYKSNLKWVAE